MHLSAGQPSEPALMVVMGVSGCGKSTIAAALAEKWGAAYLDADEYHPPANIAKMSQGEALNDTDRWPWLKHFGQAMAAQNVSQSAPCIGACSALKRSYRTALTAAAAQPILFIHLDGSRALLSERITARSDHFMPPALLDSQLNTLEAPTADDEYALTVDISGTPEQIVAWIMQQLGNNGRT